MPQFIQEDMKNQFGENSCVIKFVAPSSVGVYDAKIVLNVSSLVNELYTTIGVQELFVHANPVGNSGEFSFAASPGSTVYLSINAYDPVTGTKISPSKILSVILV
jgi:hypothetical protein